MQKRHIRASQSKAKLVEQLLHPEKRVYTAGYTPNGDASGSEREEAPAPAESSRAQNEDAPAAGGRTQGRRPSKKRSARGRATTNGLPAADELPVQLIATDYPVAYASWPQLPAIQPREDVPIKDDGESTDEDEGEVVRRKNFSDFTNAELRAGRQRLFATFFPSRIARNPTVSNILVSFGRWSSV
jgi:hypothetical protein